jgi:hypothetical protein
MLTPRLRRVCRLLAVSVVGRFGISNIPHWLLEAAAGAADTTAAPPATAPAATITAPMRLQDVRIRPIKLTANHLEILDFDPWLLERRHRFRRPIARAWRGY